MKNGIGRDYSSKGILAFKGEYIYNERDGMGIEFNAKNGEKIFEGKYHRGMIWEGIGIEYNDYGKIIYKGEFSYGLRNGKGREYDKYGKLIFEGEYLNGKRI